jgi:hypothetical protein
MSDAYQKKVLGLETGAMESKASNRQNRFHHWGHGDTEGSHIGKNRLAPHLRHSAHLFLPEPILPEPTCYP